MTNEGKIFRVIDANTNRAVEGLRVMEDVARFVLDHKGMTNTIKQMRSRIRKTCSSLVENEFQFQRRNIRKDVGRKSYTRSEKKRRTIKDVFIANAKRVQEALRVLEEFAKLIDPAAGKVYKQARFKLYAIEKRAAGLLH